MEKIVNYKEKYKQALDRASKLRVQNPFDTVGQMVEHVFPELREPEDESIRNGLIALLQFGLEDGSAIAPGFNVTKEQALAWLEKQDGHKPYGQRKECEDCQFNYAGECKGYCALKRNEHKPTDEVKPKFHEGDYIVPNDITFPETWMVINIDKDGYYNIQCITNPEYDEIYRVPGFVLEKDYHPWSINDAKDGDVLATSVGAFIYNGNDGGGSCPGSYCGINTLGKFQTGTESHWTSKKVYPATKEQCDFLFQNMAGEGYKWDADKKELLHKQS